MRVSDWSRDLWEKLHDVIANEEAWAILEEARKGAAEEREPIPEAETGASDDRDVVVGLGESAPRPPSGATALITDIHEPEDF